MPRPPDPPEPRLHGHALKGRGTLAGHDRGPDTPLPPLPRLSAPPPTKGAGHLGAEQQEGRGKVGVALVGGF